VGFKRIRREELIEEKWNSCIETTERYRLYAQLWFLDLVCVSGWDVLVWDDYRAVFPLPISGKLGLSFLQNPNLMQQVDVYGNITHEEQLDLELYITKTYKYIALSTSFKPSTFHKITKRTNLFLPVDDYLDSKPSSTLRNNLKRALKDKLTLKYESDYKNGLKFLKEHFHLTGHIPNEKEWQFYESVMRIANKKKASKFIFVMKEDVPIQFSFWIIGQNTAYYLLNISSPEGRKSGASHFAIHQFITENKNTIKLIDFEGSSIDGVKRFYKSFGAQEESYYLSQVNHLPFFLKWFKK